MSHEVALVGARIGGGQLMTGGRLSRRTVTVLLVVSTRDAVGENPVDSAVLTTVPDIISAIVTVWVAVQLALAPGTSVYGAPVHVTVAFGSVMVMPVTVTLPVLVTLRV